MIEKQRLGIIQSRGLGDIIIALPIARWYHDRGCEILWPICEQFLPSVKDSVPWVGWIPITQDLTGAFFYDTPYSVLQAQGCDEIMCLYQSLTGHPELAERPEFQIMKFDQYKYAVAGVPFQEKWRLSACITRDRDREQALKDRLTRADRPYVVLHLEGSDHRAEFDRNAIPVDWDQIEITADQTPSIFDWITLLAGAESIICVDSVMANLVDQLGLGDDRYFVPRSHIHLTPVLGQVWRVLDPAESVKSRMRIFASR